MCNEFTSICIETACIETTLYRNDREPWVCFIHNGDLFSLWYGIGIETIWSNVSLYRIDFTCGTNLLQFVSKRLVSKRLCIETTVNLKEHERDICRFRVRQKIRHSLLWSEGNISDLITNAPAINLRRVLFTEGSTELFYLLVIASASK